MNTLFSDEKNRVGFTWFLDVEVGGKAAEIPLQIIRPQSEKRWEIDATFIEAALSLWTFHIRATETSQKPMTDKGDNIDWLRHDLELKREVVQLLGPDEPSKTLQRDINWWVGDLIYASDNPIGQPGQGFTGPMGFANIKSNELPFGNPYPGAILDAAF